MSIFSRRIVPTCICIVLTITAHTAHAETKWSEFFDRTTKKFSLCGKSGYPPCPDLFKRAGCHDGLELKGNFCAPVGCGRIGETPCPVTAQGAMCEGDAKNYIAICAKKLDGKAELKNAKDLLSLRDSLDINPDRLALRRLFALVRLYRDTGKPDAEAVRDTLLKNPLDDVVEAWKQLGMKTLTIGLEGASVQPGQLGFGRGGERGYAIDLVGGSNSGCGPVVPYVTTSRSFGPQIDMSGSLILSGFKVEVAEVLGVVAGRSYVIPAIEIPKGPSFPQSFLNWFDPRDGEFVGFSVPLLGLGIGGGFAHLRAETTFPKDDCVPEPDDVVVTDPPTEETSDPEPDPETGPEPATYVVVRGDSLWSIALALFGDGDLNMSIFVANRGRIDDPDLIYPGQELVLPPI